MELMAECITDSEHDIDFRKDEDELSAEDEKKLEEVNKLIMKYQTIV